MFAKLIIQVFQNILREQGGVIVFWMLNISIVFILKFANIKPTSEALQTQTSKTL